MTYRLLVLVACTVLVVSCNITNTDCTDELGFQFSPHDTTIGVGEQFTAQLTFWGCGGRERLADSISFVSSDVSVAVVGATTGTVTGAHRGTATITASGQTYHVSVPITVHVR